MYKVFINNKRLILSNNKDIINDNNDPIICLKDITLVNNSIRKHLINSTNNCLIITSSNLKGLITNFEHNYHIRIAAGGWVRNMSNELLMIHRLKHWDLPKGHLENDETIENCAQREVIEETGILEPTIGKDIGVSRHIYVEDGKAILKQTHWFEMYSESVQDLIPQDEEGIEIAKWVQEEDIISYLNQSWQSLKDFYYDCVLK